MPTYELRPVRVEVMQWMEHGDLDHLHTPEQCAQTIIAWVNAHGGEARYEPTTVTETRTTYSIDHPPRIAVRTVNGWAHAAPGWYIVKGERRHADRTVCSDNPLAGTCSGGGMWREFHVVAELSDLPIKHEWRMI